LASKKNTKKKVKVPLKKDGTPDLRYAVNNTKKRKPSKYNKVLKELTKINNQLPEDQKLSIKERRRIVREQLLPQLEKIPYSKLRIKKDILPRIYKALDKIPPKEICDLNYIDISTFALVEWFSLDETIRELVPDCVYVKVSAGSYGDTKIFNTVNYDYNKKGVRQIVENIREDASNSSGTYTFSGFKKLRPRKANDGTPENYYLDFVLFVNDTPLGTPEEVKYVVPKTKKNKTKRRKVRQAIEERIKNLKSKKDSRRRAKKSVQQTSNRLKDISKKRMTPTNTLLAIREMDKLETKVKNLYKQGKITKAVYEKEMALIKATLKKINEQK
jgi:hypothetical protein